MAFRQPTFQAPQRTYTAPEESQSQAQSFQADQPLDDSQEWILFSPAPASTSYLTQTTSTDRTRTTLGHSRNSAFGSLDTAARSYGYDEDGSEQTEGAIEDEEDGELDSLDSHLHEFRAELSVYADDDNLNQSSHPVLPTHDGLGSFRIDQTTMHEGVQEHLYAFEQHNPRRIKRRRESLELGQLELESDRQADLERVRRIEAWRLEQSKALIEEIQNETRRRKQSMSSDRRSLLRDAVEADEASMSGGLSAQEVKDQESEGFWTRITRRVIRDLMGIDDNTLSILFGESIVQDEELSSTPTASQTLASVSELQKDTWEYRLLDRVARELGLLINQLSDHPGAFSTYLEMRSAPLPYAGLPIIPETSTVSQADRRPSTIISDATPVFHPTLGTPAIDIPTSSQRQVDMDATPRGNAPFHNVNDNPVNADFSKEEWEQQLDIKMVFRYLRSRFTSRASSPEPPLSSSQSPPLHTDLARAARVRQHHPLVSRTHTRPERKTFKVSVPPGTGSTAGAGVGIHHHAPILHRRSSSSCASYKRELMLGKGGSIKSGSRGSSRHYWDFPVGGSGGSGSLVASGGGLGGWGEV